MIVGSPAIQVQSPAGTLVASGATLVFPTSSFTVTRDSAGRINISQSASQGIMSTDPTVATHNAFVINPSSSVGDSIFMWNSDGSTKVTVGLSTGIFYDAIFNGDAGMEFNVWGGPGLTNALMSLQQLGATFQTTGGNSEMQFSDSGFILSCYNGVAAAGYQLTSGASPSHTWRFGSSAVVTYDTTFGFQVYSNPASGNRGARMDADGTTWHFFFTNGSEDMLFSRSSVDNESCAQINFRLSGVQTLSRIKCGSAGSGPGGSGRALFIP